jgi:putative transposase
MSQKERLSLVDFSEKLSVSSQCKLLRIPRSSLYYTPREETPYNLAVMRFLDEQYFKTPFYGINRLHEELSKNDFKLSKGKLRRLMKKVNWRTLYPKKKTTRSDPEAYKYPYLLRNLTIEHPNQVWAVDITYIPMKKGFMYLFAIIDVYSRYVVSWSLSNTMSCDWIVSVLKEAFETYGRPEIINSDQGSQFTSKSYVDLLQGKGCEGVSPVKISMDGKGRALDNIYIERLWRSLKYENVYLMSYETVKELRAGLAHYFEFYNKERLHQSLDYKVPFSYYFAAA